MKIQVEARALSRLFNRRMIFSDVSFSMKEGQVLLITGRNGSGKSTLSKIIAHVLTPSRGSISITVNGAIPGFAQRYVGFVSPYMQLYDEFTARENLQYAYALRGMKPDSVQIGDGLSRVSLGDRADENVRTFSSGMKQRLKYAFALIHQPAILVLDEPMSNLDAEGIALVRSLMDAQRQHGILVVATNDRDDVQACDMEIGLHGH